MKKKWYTVTFEQSEGVFCTNLCYADSEERAKNHYSKKYAWVSVKPAEDWKVDGYKRRGMPVTEL